MHAGGRQYSRKHFLSEASLDMLVDMRQQVGGWAGRALGEAQAHAGWWLN